MFVLKKKKVVPPVRNCSPVCTAVTSLVCCFVHEAASKPILSTQISKLLNSIYREKVLKKSQNRQFTYVFKVCHSHMWWVDLYFSRQMNKPRFRVNDRDLQICSASLDLTQQRALKTKKKQGRISSFPTSACNSVLQESQRLL